ncbi:putative magnesium transporter NIPA6, partial [Mucuna pruriens]
YLNKVDNITLLVEGETSKDGVFGCVSCIVGSIDLATQPVSVVLALILHFEPCSRQTNMFVYLGICSLVGSLMVVSIKAIGIAIKLTLDGISQIAYPHTWFVLIVAT